MCHMAVAHTSSVCLPHRGHAIPWSSCKCWCSRVQESQATSVPRKRRMLEAEGVLFKGDKVCCTDCLPVQMCFCLRTQRLDSLKLHDQHARVQENEWCDSQSAGHDILEDDVLLTCEISLKADTFDCRPEHRKCDLALTRIVSERITPNRNNDFHVSRTLHDPSE